MGVPTDDASRATQRVEGGGPCARPSVRGSVRCAALWPANVAGTWSAPPGIRLVNRWFALPLPRAGLGPLLSTPVAGSLMITSNDGPTIRPAAGGTAWLRYPRRGGRSLRGFGPGTAWYRNLSADPRVEVVLPTVAFSGLAETVTDRSEWDRVLPAYVHALGLVGRLTVGDLELPTRSASNSCGDRCRWFGFVRAVWRLDRQIPGAASGLSPRRRGSWC